MATSFGDMFLKVDGARSGAIKGEANDATHGGEIDVLGWSWGMRSASAMGGSGPAAKSSLELLNIVKQVDSASTALMSVMRNNDLVKKAVLSVRKSGGSPIDYFVVTIENGRITSYDVEAAGPASETLIERVSFSFQKINVEYAAQDEKGLKKGGMSFTAEVT
jgi:type VI secretion system secreted protein Hcp